MRRQFGDWEAEFDEKLIYPSLAMLDTIDKDCPVRQQGLSLHSSPNKWRLNRRLISSSTREKQELSLLDHKAEKILRDKIREEYLKRLQKQNRNVLRRLSFHSTVQAAVTQNRQSKAVKRITDKSSDVDIVRRFSSKLSCLLIESFL